MTEKDSNPNNPHVTLTFCDERHGNLAKLINVKLEGIEKDIKDIKDSSKAWKNWGLGIVASIVSTLITAYLFIALAL